ncbi:MAG: hypothetical protein Q9208_000981 [Pyrenodesmia sp. 3 TL-2023]
MAPARSSHAVSDAAYKRVLHESRSIIDELRLQDALLKEQKAAKKKVKSTASKKPRTKTSGGLLGALAGEQESMPADAVAVPVAMGFAKLPAETNQEIAKYLPDKDLATFALVQRETRDAVLPANAGHWRVRFREQYDLRASMKADSKDTFYFYPKSPVDLMEDYKLRKLFFSRKIFFTNGLPAPVSGTVPLQYDRSQPECLFVIRRIIRESFSHHRHAPSNNHRQLARFMMKSNLLYDAFRWVRKEDAALALNDIGAIINPLLMAIHVYFFSYYVKFTQDDALTGAYPLAYRQTVYHIKWSQTVVLAPAKSPLVSTAGTIDMAWLYHATNFWRFHMVLNDDSALFDIFTTLKQVLKPVQPVRQVQHNSIKSRQNWMGSIFHPAGHTMRSCNWNGEKHDDVYLDGYFTGGDNLLEIKFDFSKQDLPWPKKFEDLVHAIPDPDEVLASDSSDGAPDWPHADFDLSNRPRDRSNLAYSYDLGYVMAKRQRYGVDIDAAPKGSDSRRRTCHKKTSVPRSGPDAYHAPLPLRRMATGGGLGNVVRKKKRTKYRVMVGKADNDCGDRALNIAAIIHPLPAQSGIQGWQRITMVTYDTPNSGTASKGYLDADEDDLSVHMRYEAIICPGHCVMFGRYHLGPDWDDEDDDDQQVQHGPFVFWSTDSMQLEDGWEYEYDDTEESEDPNDDDPIEEINEENEDDWFWLAALNAQQQMNHNV